MTNIQHNDIVVLMIPDLVDIGSLWNVLPPGVYVTTIEEVEQRFAINEKRRKLISGLKRAVIELRAAGCSTIYLDGSFITNKPHPGDYDVCWNPLNVEPTKLDPILLFASNREKQKSRYGGEFFISSAKADATHLFIQYFQEDKETGLPKDILRINL